MNVLFDLSLIAVDPKVLTVLVASSLENTEYWTHGRPLRLPKKGVCRPSPDALRVHLEGSELG